MDGADELAGLSASERFERFTAKGEECYAKMYECEPHNLKDWRDDACLNFSRAIAAARELGLDNEKVALETRVEHVRAVFNQLQTATGVFSTAKLEGRTPPEFQWGSTWGYPIVLVLAAIIALVIWWLL